jgi:two-component system, chemotaxis family, chemotaxis protein CheY
MYSLMIVDDSKIIRRKIERCNQSEKFSIVASVANGEQAIDKFIELRPALVTMDITMPEMDGIECIRSLVALDKDVKILVISALSDKATGIRALKEGAMGFLCKPFSDDQLVNALIELTED